MVTAISTTQPEMNASALAALLSYPLSDTDQDVTAEFFFPRFNYSFSAPLIGLSSSTDFQQITAQVELDENVIAICELNGKLVSNSQEIRIQEVSLRIEVTTDRVRAHFVACTLQALLCLAGPVRFCIPELRFDGQLNFTAPLEQIANFLHRRHIAYQLMVIENAFKQTFSMPLHPSDADKQSLSFAYHAITEGFVLRPFYQNSFPFRAEEQTRTLIEAGRPFPYRLVIEHLDHDLLGKTLHLGQATLTIEKAIIVNSDDVHRELEKLDGHEFPVLIRSLNGAAKYEFTGTQSWPEPQWNERITDFIRLEDQLDDSLFQAADQLAAGSLAGLTGEEQDEITKGLQLGEDAFRDFGVEG